MGSDNNEQQDYLREEESTESLRNRIDKIIAATSNHQKFSDTGDEMQRLIHELQVHQVELEIQNEELRLAREEKEAGLERYTELYDFAPVGYFTLDGIGTIRQVNLSGAAMLGVERAFIIGRKLQYFLQSKSLPVFSQFIRNAAGFPDEKIHNTVLSLKGNPPVTVQARLHINEAGDEYFMAVTDITEQKASEEHILYLNQVLLTVQNVNRLLIREKNPDRLLQATCEIMSKSGGFENAWIVRVDENNTFLAAYGSDAGRPFTDLELFLKQDGIPWCQEEALKQKDVISITDRPAECSQCPMSSFYAKKISLICSLRYEEELYGTLSVILPEIVALKREDTDLFKEVCDDVAFGLHTIGLEQKGARSLVQIQQNMMQLATLNDEIRNPLTVIKALTDTNHTEENRKIIEEQIDSIDYIIRKLDLGWLNSEKTWNYLMKNYGIPKPDNNSGAGQELNDRNPGH